MMYNLVPIAIACIFLGDAAYPQENVPDLKDPTMIAAGHDLFLQKQCSRCHGEDGKGGVNLARRALDPKDVFQSIADGRMGSGLRMPASRDVLSDEEIWKATAYVMSISQQPK
ncbi:mono/diheme cytochrome c family protein [Bradyrhizobium sp. AZCC 1578]|uniref:c-type cytochrome n=1 Tax=Bradyrhizobium sp. AZCC 1578 TaxID=3117027 RepID=UPI002FF36B11